MQRKYWISSLLLLALASLPTLAEEIVYFTNGTSMPVESYEVEDGMIRLDLGDQAYVAFPVDQIDRIETAEGVTRSSASIRANKIVASAPGGVLPAHRRQVRTLDRRKNPAAAIERDRNGIAVHRPYGLNAPPNKRQFTTVGGGNGRPTSTATEGGVIGTTPLGARFSISTAESRKKKQPVSVSRKN